MIFKDQIDQQFELVGQAQRIISLVPSITELLFDLGLEEQVVGCTKFCEHPAALTKKTTKIGGTKTPHLDQIKSLNPDLVFAAKEENLKEHIESIRLHCPVFTANATDINSALQMINDIGNVTQTSQIAKSIHSKIIDEMEISAEGPIVNCLYLIWKEPYMCAGGGTFIDSMLQWGGFKNLAREQKRYPTLSESDIQRLDPEVLMLSSEPFPFADKHLEEISRAFPKAKVMLVDGQSFSWYGAQMTSAFNYIRILKSSVFTK